MEVNLALFGTVLVVFAFLYRMLTKNNDYFHEKPIPSLAVKPLFGSTGPLVLKQYSIHGFIRYIYNKFPNAKVFGLFDAIMPIFVIRDPVLIKKITVKDFDYFLDHRPTFGDSENDSPYSLFGKSLFAMNGQKWRDMRATLSPAFTGSKMRQMFDLIIECCEGGTKYYLDRSSTRQEVGLNDLFSRFSMDVIASCAFGMRVDSFRDHNNEFYKKGKAMMRFERLSVALRMFAFKFFPKIMSKLGIDIIDREHVLYFSSIIMDAIRTRQTQRLVRSDMLNLLIQAKSGLLRHQHEKEMHEGFATAKDYEVEKIGTSAGMTDTEMIAQAFVFFLAGFETVTTTLTFFMHDLVVYEDVQQQLYEEVLSTEEKLDGKPLNYDILQQMKYMDQVLTESMRLRPAAAMLDRLCVRDYVLDDDEGLKFTINKGTTVWVPLQGLHMDEKYFPDPERFDPSRFSAENKGNIDPFTYLPFGAGPRNCIGSRFALMQIKAVVYYMLRNFRFEKNKNTQIPLKLRKGYTVVASESEVYVDIKPRNL